MKNALSLLRIGVDLDGVLNNLSEVVLTELKNRGLCPPELGFGDIKEYEFEKNVPGLKAEQVWELFREGTVFNECHVDREAKHALHSLYSAGVQIHIVTSRDFSHYHRLMTSDWLRRNDIPYHRLAIYGKKEKATYAESQGLDVFVEDHLPTAEEMSDVVRLSILLDRPYNRLPHGEQCNLVRMYSWLDIRRFFIGY